MRAGGDLTRREVSKRKNVEKEYLIKNFNSIILQRNIVAHLSHSEHGIMEDMTIDEPYVYKAISLLTAVVAAIDEIWQKHINDVSRER